MKVEQAVFGELDRGHGLLAATGDGRFAAGLAPRLDLPDTAPPGVAWSPYPSGFAHRDRYVLARTFPDPGATRPGMVLTHALIAPLEEVTGRDDLRDLLAALPTEARRPSDLAALDLDARPAPAPDHPELVGLAEALVTGGDGPVVRFGVDGFEDLVVALWRRLWPSVRRNLSFRLSFGPDDVREEPRPTLVCSPPALATRWRGARVVDPTPRGPGSASAAALAGHARADSPLAFAVSIGADLATFAELRLAERALDLDGDAATSFDDAVAMVRLVQRLSPDPDAGAGAKAGILDRLPSHLAVADGRAVLMLRNLELGGFHGASVVWDGVARVVASGDHHPAADGTWLSIVGAALGSSGAVAPWREAVSGGLRATARRTGGGFPAAFWRWVGAEPGLVGRLAEAVDLDPVVERHLVDGAPRIIGGDPAGAVASIARERGLCELHGIAMSTVRPASEAARAQIAMEGNSPGGRGLALALRDATARETLACALTLDDPRLVDLAAEALVGRPGLLADVGTARGQAIWAAALSLDPLSWAAPVDPEGAVRTVVANLVDGGVADRGLVGALGSTPLADLHHFERRSEAWDRLRASAGSAYLDATAAGWVRRSAEGGVVQAPDRTLEDAILGRSPFRAGGAAIDLAGGVRIASALPRLGEHDVSAWFERTIAGTRVVAGADAEALGRLVLARGWRRILDGLKRGVRAGRADLRPALVAAAPMLGLFDGWLLQLSIPSSDEKWDGLVQLAADLYPSGPADGSLWERAGGNDADLPTSGSGRELWRDALRRMRLGGGRVRVERLLREMGDDWPDNERVRLLASDTDFGGGRWKW